MALTPEQIQQAYVTFFSRPADALGLNYWSTYEGSVQDLYNTFAVQDEYAAAFEGLSNGASVQLVYNNLFGRSADADGLLYWTNQLNNGAVTIASLALALTNGALDSDATTLANRVTAATAFTAELDTTEEILGYSGTDANIAAKAWLSNVTDDASLAAAIADAALTAAVADVVDVGQTTDGGTVTSFSLTDALGENVVGTAGADSFSAVLDGLTPANGTLNVGDKIDGLGGNDTFNLISTGGGTLPAGVVVDNVEVVNITHVGGLPAALSSAQFGGVQQLWQINTDGSGFGDVTIANDVTAGFRSTGVKTTAIDVFNNINAASATQTDLNIALDGTGQADLFLFGAGVDTVNVSGSIAEAAATNILWLNQASATDIETINVAMTSDTEVIFAGAYAEVTTVDLTGSTGNLTADATGLVKLETLTGGAGSDTLVVDLEQDLAVTVDAGDGNDTVQLAGTGAGDNTASTVTLGAGDDTIQIFSALSNIADAAEADFADGITTVADFNVADDVLDLSDPLLTVATLTNTQLANIAAEDNLFDAVSLAANTVVAGDTTVFNYGDNAYVFSDTSATATFDDTDGLVELTGVQVEEFTATNFVT